MKPNHFFWILSLIVVLGFTTCQKESIEQESISELKSEKSDEKRRPHRCIEYEWSYTCSRTDGESPYWIRHPLANTFIACADEFRGFERLIGTRVELNPDIEALACLGTDQNANANCYGLLELFTRINKRKYHVVFTPYQDIDDPRGRWSNCLPVPETTTCFDIKWMEITPDGRHDKDCLTNGSVSIPKHTFCITNHGPSD